LTLAVAAVGVVVVEACARRLAATCRTALTQPVLDSKDTQEPEVDAMMRGGVSCG
jgi:hypothetical protein